MLQRGPDLAGCRRASCAGAFMGQRRRFTRWLRVGARQALHFGKHEAEMLGVDALLALGDIAATADASAWPRPARRRPGRPSRLAVRATSTPVPGCWRPSRPGWRSRTPACRATGDRARPGRGHGIRRCRRRIAPASRASGAGGSALPSATWQRWRPVGHRPNPAGVPTPAPSGRCTGNCARSSWRSRDPHEPSRQRRAVRQLQQRVVAKIGDVAEVRQPVLGRAPPLQLGCVLVQQPGLADQVQAVVGQRQVFLEDGAVAAPFGVALAEDQRVVGEVQQVVDGAAVRQCCPSHVPHFVRDFVEGRVAVDLVGGRVEELALVARVAGGDGGRRARPRCSRLPGGACRRRAPSAAHAARRWRAGCRSACAPGPACCGQRLPRGAIPSGRGMSVVLMRPP